MGSQPNLLIITVDDMNCDSVGVYGCRLANTTPHIDRLAKSALRFEHAHVQVGNCMPSRNVMWSGLYPHRNGVEGFYQVPDAKHAHLCDLAKSAGYFTAIRYKISHSTPYSPYAWDLELDSPPDGSQPHIKDAVSYGESTRIGIEAARKTNRPFCLVLNISDPHKPFYSDVKSGKDPHIPSKVFTAAEVPVPGFLFDDPAVRKELAKYYSSVRRADDAVGSILDALKQSGASEETLVLFLSDHGMPLPFAKTQLYHHSTRTPLMIRWPGVTRPDTVDRTHMVSAVDLMPTLLEIMGQGSIPACDGRSFAGLLHGEPQSNREAVFKEYNENSGGKRNPMRGVETREYLYLYNPWSDGKLNMATATDGTATYKRMQQLAKDDPAMAERLRIMDHRDLEELYHVASDPDCLHNLITDPAHAVPLRALRTQLSDHLKRTDDPLDPVFANRDDAQLRASYMEQVQHVSDQRRAARRQNKKAGGRQSAERNPPPAPILQFSDADWDAENQAWIITLSHQLTDRQGKQQLVVTLKSATGERLHRVSLAISGTGKTAVKLAVPEGSSPRTHLRVAAFVGDDYAHSLHYVQSKLDALL